MLSVIPLQALDPDNRLLHAARAGILSQVKSALDDGASIDTINKSIGFGSEWAETPLIYAVREQHYEVAAYLLEQGADPNKYTAEYYRTPLLFAADIDLIRLLIEHGADLHYESSTTGQNVLHTAVLAGNLKISSRDVETAEFLIQHGADTTVRDYRGRTLLHLAAHMENHESESIGMIDVLLRNDVDPSLTDNKGMTPLLIAADRRVPSLMQFMLDAGVPNTHPLHIAVAQNNADEVARLLDQGENPDRPISGNQQTPMHWVAKQYRFPYAETDYINPFEPERADIAQMLVDAGGDLEVRDSEGYTPLLRAIEHGRDSHNPFEITIEHENQAIIEIFLDAGARLDVATNKGESPLDIARRRSNRLDAWILRAMARQGVL